MGTMSQEYRSPVDLTDIAICHAKYKGTLQQSTVLPLGAPQSSIGPGSCEVLLPPGLASHG
jgi:hypothetical protein